MDRQPQPDHVPTTQAPDANESSPAPALHFDIFTLFPGMFAGPLSESIVQRARDRDLIAIDIHDLRTWATDRHRTADDTPYGGGAGMVMLAPPIVDGVEAVLGDDLPQSKVIILSAAGRLFSQAVARELARVRRLVLICGHYEGIDERAAEILDADLLSIGDYVLTGGELPAMVVIDAVTRLVPGVIDQASVSEESHDAGLVEYPHYTRPAVVRGRTVPDVLLSGHHARIARWRRDQAIRRTALRRPDLLPGATLTSDERADAENIAAQRSEPDQPPSAPSAAGAPDDGP